MNRVYDWFGGRSMFLALLLLAVGTGLAIAHLLDATYVGFAAIIQGLVTARAISADNPGPGSGGAK